MIVQNRVIIRGEQEIEKQLYSQHSSQNHINQVWSNGDAIYRFLPF